MHLLFKVSVTAPISTSTEKSKTVGAGGRQLRATKSSTAPVSPASKPLSKPVSRPVKATNVSNNTLPKTVNSGAKKASPYPKKVSSEYHSEIVFKNQEGLKFSSVNFFDNEEEGSQTR